MWKILSLLFSISLCFSLTEIELKDLVEGAIKEKFGEKVKVGGIQIHAWKDGLKENPQIELDMEYGKARALAYLDFGERRISATVDVYWKAKFFVAKEDIQRGTILSPELFTEEEKWLKSIPNDFRINREELKNYQASILIPKGSTLRRSIMKPLPAVSRGETVKLILRSENVEIATWAVSLDRGGIGKIVRIKTQGGKIMRGRIVDRGVVEVVE